jgi:hypothetical protein
MGWLICELFFVGMAQVKELQGTLEELVDFIFADFVGSQQCVKIEIREAAIGHAGGKKFPQAARLDGAERADFFEYHAAERILKDTGIEQFADFRPRAGLNQHGAKKTQRIPLEERPAICLWNGHTSPFCRGLPGSICRRIAQKKRCTRCPRRNRERITLNKMVGV